MKFDETELIEFFGVLPVQQNPEEKEFFGSSQFEISRGKFILHVSFSATHAPKVIIDLFYSYITNSVLHVAIQNAFLITTDKKTRCLRVLTASSKEKAKDTDFEERLKIYLEPLKVTVSE